MKKFIKTTPDGVKDLLFGECDIRRDIEIKLKEVFGLRGYKEIITPALEYYDIFSFDTSYIPMQEMYKLTDLNGRMLVLRPDITIPIARVVATHLKDEAPPIKLCYNQSVYRMAPNLSGQRDEIAQSGVELIGVNGLKSDLEIITTAVAALQSFCGNAFRFEIGHVGFFKTLIEKLPLNHAQSEEIYELMRAKNYAPLNDLLSEYKHIKAARGLMRLPRMFGGAEVLEEIKEFGDDEQLLETLNYVEELYDSMLRLGFGDNVMIDLGVVPGNAYYSGVVFRGYLEGAGMPVLSGGRYDKLLAEFGRDLPAVGFAIYIDEAVKPMHRAVNAPFIRECVVHAQKGYEIKALEYADMQRVTGIPCYFSMFDDLIKSGRYASAKNADLVLVGEQVKYILKDGIYEMP